MARRKKGGRKLGPKGSPKTPTAAAADVASIAQLVRGAEAAVDRMDYAQGARLYERCVALPSAAARPARLENALTRALAGY